MIRFQNNQDFFPEFLTANTPCRTSQGVRQFFCSPNFSFESYLPSHNWRRPGPVSRPNQIIRFRKTDEEPLRNIDLLHLPTQAQPAILFSQSCNVLSSCKDGFLGEGPLFAGNFVPRSWAFFAGQLLAINLKPSIFMGNKS